jgi:hypothetical protein
MRTTNVRRDSASVIMGQARHCASVLGAIIVMLLPVGPPLDADEAGPPYTSATAPREQPVPPSPELIERIRTAPPLTAVVMRGPAGAPELHIDGKPASLLGGQQLGLGWPKDLLHIAPYRDGGIDLIMVSVNVGFYTAAAGYLEKEKLWPSFWVGAGEYRPEVVEHELWRTLTVHPEAAILVRIWMTPYPSWTSEHPDAVMRNIHGHPLVATTHFLRYDPKGPDPDPLKREQFAASFHSDDFLRDTERTIEALVAAVEQSVPGRRVAGYFIGGGQDGQLYDWAPPDNYLEKDIDNWGDFSPAAQVAWRRWLEARYGTPAMLSVAWGREVTTFTAAPLPTKADLIGTQTLHHPVAGRIASDWNRFTADARLRLLSTLAKAVKRTARRPLVVGVAGGFSPRKDLSQTASLLRDPSIDFLRHQVAYGQRQPGMVGGINAQLASHAVNGRLFFADVDHPTWLVPGNVKMSIGLISQTSDSRGRADGPTMLSAMWRREHGLLAAEGAGSLIHPILGAPWMYADPAVVQEFRVLANLYHGIRPGLMGVRESPVAWVYDERSRARLKAGVAKVGQAWTRHQQNEMLASGIPFRAYYAEDLEDGLMPPARLVVMPNLLEFTPQLRAGLERLKGEGRTLVFCQATGWEHLARGDADTVAAATGLRLALASDSPAPAQGPDGNGELALAEVAWAPVPASAATGAALLAAMPEVAAEAWQALPNLDQVDGAALLGVAPANQHALRLRARLHLDAARTVTVRLSADWWADVAVDGVTVAAITRQNVGVPDRPAWGTVALPAGDHRIEARLVSGAGGFRCSIRFLDVQEPPLGQLQDWIEDPQAALTVTDPAATVLARYPSGRPSLAIVDHGSWRAVFAGSWTLAAPLINRLAREAGGWTPCPPDVAVVAAGSGVLMLHALRDGPCTLVLPEPLALTPVDGGAARPAAVEHRLDLRRGETSLWWWDGQRSNRQDGRSPDQRH